MNFIKRFFSRALRRQARITEKTVDKLPEDVIEHLKGTYDEFSYHELLRLAKERGFDCVPDRKKLTIVTFLIHKDLNQKNITIDMVK